MGKVGHKFMAGAKKDLAAWNCETMYPEPQPVDLGIPNWIKKVDEYAQKGFQVYNMVKKFIPGGSKAGAGPVPGSPDSELMELAEFDWGQAAETAKGLGDKLLKDMQKA